MIIITEGCDSFYDYMSALGLIRRHSDRAIRIKTYSTAKGRVLSYNRRGPRRAASLGGKPEESFLLYRVEDKRAVDRLSFDRDWVHALTGKSGLRETREYRVKESIMSSKYVSFSVFAVEHSGRMVCMMAKDMGHMAELIEGLPFEAKDFPAAMSLEDQIVQGLLESIGIS